MPFVYKSYHSSKGSVMPRLWVLSALLLLLVTFARAQDISEVTRKIHRSYRGQDGLPQASVSAIGIDSRGWVWVGTQNGVAYFDGRAWHTIEAFNRAIDAGFWRGKRIVEDEDGTLWFGTQRGALSLHPQPPVPAAQWAFEHYTTADGLPSDTVTNILLQPNGAILFGTLQGVAVFRENTWRTLALPPALDGAMIFALHETNAGDLLLGTQAGLFRRKDEQWRQVPLPSPFADNTVFAIQEDLSGALWLTLEEGVIRSRGDDWDVALAAEGVSFVSIAQDHRGRMWVGTASNGVYVRESDGSWSTITPQDGLLSQSVHAIAAHPDGTMWIGTVNGLWVYDSTDWDVIDNNNGLPANNVWAIFQRENADYWFGTQQAIGIYGASGWRYLNEGPAGAPIGIVLAFHEAPDSSMWFGGSNGLYRFNDGEWLLHRPDLFTYAFLRRPDGTLLVSTRTGVWSYANGSLQPFRPESALLRRSSKALGQTRDGALLVAIEGAGVLRLREGETRLFTEDDGLVSSSVLDIYEDPDGLMWFVTTEGVSLFDGRHWRTLSDTSQPALPDRFTYRVERDGLGGYYISTNRGIVRLTKLSTGGNDLQNLAFELEHFGMDDGLPAFEANQGASFRDAKGRIWFGLTGGAVVYSPRAETSTPMPGPITFVSIQMADVSDSLVIADYYEDGRLTLGYGHSTVRLVYAMGSPGHAEDIQFKTRLIGLDEPASEWSSSTDTYYTRLPAGDYTLEVIGRLAEGGPTRTASLPLRVMTPPWATGWAYGGYILMILLIGAGLAFTQTSRSRRRDDEKSRREQERLSRAAAMSRAAYLQSENERLAERNRSHEFRRRVMEGSSDAIFSLDPEGRVTLYNAPFRQMLGAQTGQDFRLLFDEVEGRKINRAFRKVVSNGHTIHDLALEMTPEDASPRYLALALSPLRVEGELEGVVGVARDVTEKRNLEQFRNDMIRMFVHDLRNPLSNMLMAGHALAEDDLDRDDYRRMAKMIETNCEQAILLVEGMLDVSRLEAGRMPIELEEITLADVVREVVEPMTPMAEKKNLSLEVNAVNGLPSVYADAGLLRRILRNLIDNAIKFTPPSGAIIISARRDEEERLEVSIQDTGPGVPEDLRPYLFQKFAAGAGPDSGSGLGLAFCRLAVESLGGRLWLDTDAKNGAVFRFTLQSKQEVPA